MLSHVHAKAVKNERERENKDTQMFDEHMAIDHVYTFDYDCCRRKRWLLMDEVGLEFRSFE